MEPLVERDMEDTLLTELLELIEAEAALLAKREERASESERAGKVRDELDADDASVEGRDEESLALRWPRRASPSRGCEAAERPNEGILEPVEGRESDAVDEGMAPVMLVELEEAERLGSKSTSDGAPDCESFSGVYEVRRDVVVDECEGLCAIDEGVGLEPRVA